MSTVDEILREVPMEQLASELELDVPTTRELAVQATQLLISGMSANALDEGGARSLASAMADHAADPMPQTLAQVDTADGQKIVRHIFGDNTDQVVQTLGEKSRHGSSEIVQKLLPILAPIVLAYLSRRVKSGKYGDILGPILDGAAGQMGGRQAPQSGGLAGTVLNEILEQMLGGGSRSQPAPQQPQQPAPTQPTQPAESATRPGINAPDRMDVDTPQPPTQSTPAQSTPAQSTRADGDPVLDLLKDLLGRGRRS